LSSSSNYDHIVQVFARKGLVSCAVLACLLFAGVAVARPPSSPNKLVLDKLTKTGSGQTMRGHFRGHLKSPDQECLAERAVKLYLHNGSTGESKLVDTDITGKFGHWHLFGRLYMIDRARIKLRGRVVGSLGHRRRCESDTLTRRFA
jgi:hypothetical protein